MTASAHPDRLEVFDARWTMRRADGLELQGRLALTVDDGVAPDAISAAAVAAAEWSQRVARMAADLGAELEWHPDPPDMPRRAATT